MNELLGPALHALGHFVQNVSGFLYPSPFLGYRSVFFAHRSSWSEALYSSSQPALSRTMLVADSPAALSPKIALRASVKSPVEIPFKYRAGISASMLGTRRIYLGRISLLKLPPSRCRTRGWRIFTGPTPVTQSRSGRSPFPTTPRSPA